MIVVSIRPDSCGWKRKTSSVELEGKSSTFLVLLLDDVDIWFSFLPYIGMVTIVMNDHPQLKYLVLAVLGFFVLVHREN